MSGYLQYSNYGDDEPPTLTPPQPKRTLRTNQRTLRSRPSAARPTQPPAQPAPAQSAPAQSAQSAQPAPAQPSHPAQSAHNKYVQELIQQIHNGGGDSDSESSDSDTNYFSQSQPQQRQQMQQQFQTQPVPNRNRFAAANSSDLNARLNPAPATATNPSMMAREGFALADAVFQASSNETGAGENKDVLLQKLDHIISLLEDQQDAKTGHVTEELVLYCFLGVFIIFIVDSFARAGKYVR